MSVELGTLGAWFNPVYEDAIRVIFIVEAEALGYTTAWLGLGRHSVGDLEVVEQALDATTTINVATAVVNVWTNDATTVGRSYQRIVAKHPNRFLLGVGVGHPEQIGAYRSPLETLARYLDLLDAGGVHANDACSPRSGRVRFDWRPSGPLERTRTWWCRISRGMPAPLLGPRRCSPLSTWRW